MTVAQFEKIEEVKEYVEKADNKDNLYYQVAFDTIISQFDVEEDIKIFLKYKNLEKFVKNLKDNIVLKGIFICMSDD